MNTINCKAVLLDVDGTLLDSNDAHARAWLEVLLRNGHDVTFEQVRPLIGKGGDKLLEELVGFDDETEAGKQLSKERRQTFEARYVSGLKPTEGARALLEHFKSHGVQLIVATSAGGEELDGLLRQAGIDDLIEQASSSSEAEQSKPDPDIVAVALAKAGVEAHEAVMLGDTPYDIESARGCRVETVALRCGGWWDDRALAGATAVYDDPAAFLRALQAG